MNKKWNIWLIVASVLLAPVLLFMAKSTAMSSSVATLIISAASLVLSFGIINYTKWNIWLKLILSVILAVFISLLVVIILFINGGDAFPFM